MNDTSTDFPLRRKKHGVDIQLNSQNFVQGRRKETQKIINALSINTSELDWNKFIGINQQDMVMNSHNERALNSMIAQYLKKMFGDDIVSSNVEDLHFDDNTRVASFRLRVVININHQQETLTPAFHLDGGD